MAANLNFGSVPQLYREVYQNICPNQESFLDRDAFIQLFTKTNLPKTSLAQIWEISGKNCLNRTGVYKALALIGFAQQGKPISEKLLNSFAGEELPKPDVGDLNELRSVSIQLRRKRNPGRLSLSYAEICQLDTVQVQLVPEKKGLFLKHAEYEVSSERHRAVVQRRFSDFVVFRNLLLVRFPYRLVPPLPPKKMVGRTDNTFIEERRKGLRRFLTLVARHPVMQEERLVFFFLTFSGSDIQHKMKEHFRGLQEEYVTSEVAGDFKDLVPHNTSSELNSVKEQMNQVYNCIHSLRNAAFRITERSEENAVDILVFGKELSALTTSAATESSWGLGDHTTWDYLRKGLKHLYPLFSAVSQALTQQASIEEAEVVQELNLFLDILIAYKEVCQRHELEVLSEQRQLNRLKRRTGQQFNHLEESDAVAQMENRRLFALHCLHMETQLVYAYMEILVHVLHSLVTLQAHWLNKLTGIWEEMCPLVDSLVPLPATQVSPSNQGQR